MPLHTSFHLNALYARTSSPRLQLPGARDTQFPHPLFRASDPLGSVELPEKTRSMSSFLEVRRWISSSLCRRFSHRFSPCFRNFSLPATYAVDSNHHLSKLLSKDQQEGEKGSTEGLVSWLCSDRDCQQVRANHDNEGSRAEDLGQLIEGSRAGGLDQPMEGC